MVNSNKMVQLYNTKEDRESLDSIISSGEFPLASIKLGVFENKLAFSFTTKDYIGKITYIDLESGYCKWIDESGNDMSYVTIESISLLL